MSVVKVDFKKWRSIPTTYFPILDFRESSNRRAPLPQLQRLKQLQKLLRLQKLPLPQRQYLRMMEIKRLVDAVLSPISTQNQAFK